MGQVLLVPNETTATTKNKPPYCRLSLSSEGIRSTVLASEMDVEGLELSLMFHRFDSWLPDFWPVLALRAAVLPTIWENKDLL